MVELDFRENGLITKTDSVVAASVEGLEGKSAEVTDVRAGDGDEALEEFPHARSAQSDAGSDGLTFADLEVCHRLAGVDHRGLLTGDFSDFINGVFDSCLSLVDVVADVRVDGDFFEAGNLVDVFEAQFFLEAFDQLLVVVEFHGIGGQRGY